MHPTLATLMVARDAAEEGNEAMRALLLDELCEVEWKRKTARFAATRWLPGMREGFAGVWLTEPGANWFPVENLMAAQERIRGFNNRWTTTDEPGRPYHNGRTFRQRAANVRNKARKKKRGW